MANHRASSCGEEDRRGWVETGPQAERGEVKIGEAGAIGTPIGGLGAASGVRVGKEQPEWWPTKLPAALLMSLPASLLAARLALLPVHIPESG